MIGEVALFVRHDTTNAEFSVCYAIPKTSSATARRAINISLWEAIVDCLTSEIQCFIYHSGIFLGGFWERNLMKRLHLRQSARMCVPVLEGLSFGLWR